MIEENGAHRGRRFPFGRSKATTDRLPRLVAARVVHVLSDRTTRRHTVAFASPMREALAAVGRDFMFGARQFRRSPTLTAGIILSLGFGIGASGTVFSWME